MGGDPFDIKNLCSPASKLLQKSGLSGPGTATDEHQAVRQRHLIKSFYDLMTVALVTTIEDLHPPSNLIQDSCKSTRALPSSPAIHKRLPCTILIGKRALQMGGSILSHLGTPNFASAERADVGKDSTDFGSLCVA